MMCQESFKHARSITLSAFFNVLMQLDQLSLSFMSGKLTVQFGVLTNTLTVVKEQWEDSLFMKITKILSLASKDGSELTRVLSSISLQFS
jgi:hypothetical protein